MEGQHAQMFFSNSGYFCIWKAALYVDRAPTADSETCTHERSSSRLSESHSGWFSVTTPPLFFSLKASLKSTFYPDWKWWRCNRLRLMSSTSVCLSPSAQTWTPPPFPPLSPVLLEGILWGYTMNVEQGVDRGGFCSQQQRRLMVHESLRLFPPGGRNPHVTPSIRKHVRFMFHSSGLHGTTAGRSGRSRLRPLRKQQQQNAAVIKEQRWGKRRYMNTSWCVHGSRSLMP